MAHKIYQLKVKLEGSEPLVSHRIMVAANLTLMRSHGVLLQVMGWQAGKDYRFLQDGREFGELELCAGEYVEDASMFSLRHCLCLPGHTLQYAYGGRQLSLVLEAIEEVNGRFRWRLLDGERVH